MNANQLLARFLPYRIVSTLDAWADPDPALVVHVGARDDISPDIPLYPFTVRLNMN